MTYTDEDLIAFHNGTLASAVSDAILDAIETDAELAQRLIALDPAAQMVKETFIQLKPDTEAVMPVTSTNLPWKPLAIASSIAAAALAVWTVLPQSSEPWHQQVSAYQVLYTTQTIAGITPTDADLAEQFSMLEEALSIEFGANQLEGVQGLDLLRAQLLGFEGAPLGQIVFADHLGRPIALCLIEGSGDNRLRQKELSGLNTISWGSGTHQFLLVGSVSEHELWVWAETLRDKV